MATEDRPALLVVESDPALQKQMQAALDRYDLVLAQDRDGAIAMLRRHEPAVMTLDLRASSNATRRDDGFRTLEEILSLAPATKIIAITDRGDRAGATRAIGLGAHNFFETPLDATYLQLIVGRAFRVAELERESIRVTEATPPSAIEGVITRDPRMLRICRQLERLSTGTETVTFIGESGTGKELLANGLHALSPRASQRFVRINCETMLASNFESELFGSESGDPGEARRATPGRLELANGGTLFLDGISELPAAIQARLLRFLEQRTIVRIGGTREVQLDVRLVCASRRNLRDAVVAGTFRHDLCDRLSEFTVTLPPLRERAGDAALLAHAFARKYGAQRGRRRLTLTEAALNAIETYRWPGNVRELENCIKRAVIVAEGRAITPPDLGLEVREDTQTLNLRKVRDEAERHAVLKVMARSDGNVARAAELLGVSRPTLYDLLNRFGLR
jgi:two-component system NtrC family response regulator